MASSIIMYHIGSILMILDHLEVVRHVAKTLHMYCFVQMLVFHDIRILATESSPVESVESVDKTQKSYLLARCTIEQAPLVFQ